jgi:diphthamide synthase (EF-2-diphthine--ammonia ligase)
MSDEFLGQVLSREVADAIEASGADICGENGEYHTFTFDGPIFKNKVHYSFKDKIINDKYTLFTIE